MKRVPQRKGALLPVYRQFGDQEEQSRGLLGRRDTGDTPTCTAAFLHVRPALTESTFHCPNLLSRESNLRAPSARAGARVYGNKQSVNAPLSPEDLQAMTEP